MIPQQIQQRLSRIGIYVAVFVITVFIATPLYLMVIVSIQSPEALYSGGGINLIPTDFTTRYYLNLLETTETVTFFKNSIIVSLSSTVVSTVIAVAGGYTLSHFQFRGRKRIAQLVLFSYMFSPIILAIPLYVLFQRLGLINSYISLTLGITAISAPFSIWLMWQFFQTIPSRLEESGWVRGGSRLRVIWDVVLPVARPGYISAAIFAFAVAWNDFTISRVLLSERSMYTINVGASLFLGRLNIGWGERMATSVLICIPPLIITFLFQQYLIRGFSMGGLE